jgi:hypothetical protein
VLLCTKITNAYESTPISNSSSTSSLTNLVSNTQAVCLPTRTDISSTQYQTNLEELINFQEELSKAERSTAPSYLITNISFNNSSQYAFLVTMHGDVFLLKIGETAPIKTALWHLNLNIIVMKYYKIDLNVSYYFV